VPDRAGSTVTAHHLAQLNIGRLRAPIEDPLIAEFADALDPVNALAERSDGFVWRFQTEEGDATSVRPFDDDGIIVNFSTWESIEALADFVYRSDHTAFMRRRREWFERFDGVFQVLWWVPAGHRPTVDEAIERLELLRSQGPTAQAFTFRHRFAPDATPISRQPDVDRDACPA
jgi:Domain of unknown function (DUF3291)